MQATTPPINSIPDINESIHLSYNRWLTYLSSIAAGFTVNLSAMPHDHTGCIPHNREISLSTTQLLNLHTCCRLHGQSTYQLPTPRSGNLSISHVIDQSTS